MFWQEYHGHCSNCWQTKATRRLYFEVIWHRQDIAGVALIRESGTALLFGWNVTVTIVRDFTRTVATRSEIAKLTLKVKIYADNTQAMLVNKNERSRGLKTHTVFDNRYQAIHSRDWGKDLSAPVSHFGLCRYKPSSSRLRSPLRFARYHVKLAVDWTHFRSMALQS